MAAVLVGGVLLGTGVAVSAKTVPLAAAANKKKPTTTTSTSSTTTSTAPGATTTTTEPCNPASASANATAGDGTGTATVSPATCLLNGTVVTISATGLMKKSGSNFLGTILECNSDPSQPTVSLLGHDIPVSCTGALANKFTPNAQGTFTGQLSIIEGTTGPPTPGVDSTGGQANVDAANYPCPPTPAQMAETPPVTCVVAIGDTGGDQIAVPVSFNPNVAPPPAVVNTSATTSTTSAAQAAAAKTAAAKAAATKASSNSLAFTGSGPGLWWLALVGVLLMLLGLGLLTIVDQPRRLIRLALHRATRSRHDT
jgi:hypothetical protein